MASTPDTSKAAGNGGGGGELLLSPIAKKTPLQQQNTNTNNANNANVNVSSSSADPKQHHHQQHQQQHASIVELTSLRFDVDRLRSTVEQKSRALVRTEGENARLVETIERLRAAEAEKRAAADANLHVEIDALRRQLHTTREENNALTLAKGSLDSRVETAERRVAILRQLEETNEILQKELSSKEGEAARLKQDVAAAEKRAAEAAQASLCNVLQGKIGALEDMVAERDASLDEMRTHCANLESNLTDSRQLNAANNERCSELEKLVGELRVALTGLKSDLAASERLVEAQHEDFSKRFEDLAGAKAHVEHRCTLLEELNGELRAEARDLARRAQDKEFVITEVTNELSVTKHELQAAKHAAGCAAEDERSAIDRLKKVSAAAADRESQIAKQQLIEQNLRADADAARSTLAAAHSDANRMREELAEAHRRCDLLSHQAAQRDGADERARQLQRQLQRTLEESDSLRDAVAVARRREVDVETALVRARESHALVERLQSDLEARDAHVAALNREKLLAAAELEALREDLVRARAQTSGGVSPQMSPNRRRTTHDVSPRNASPLRAATGPTDYTFGRHFTPPRDATTPPPAQVHARDRPVVSSKRVSTPPPVPKALQPLPGKFTVTSTTSPTPRSSVPSPTAAGRSTTPRVRSPTTHLARPIRGQSSIVTPERPANTRRGPRQMA